MNHESLWYACTDIKVVVKVNSVHRVYSLYTESTMHNSVSLLTLFWRRYLDQLCLPTEPSISDKNDHILLHAIFFFFPPCYLPTHTSLYALYCSTPPLFNPPPPPPPLPSLIPYLKYNS